MLARPNVYKKGMQEVRQWYIKHSLSHLHDILKFFDLNIQGNLEVLSSLIKKTLYKEEIHKHHPR